MTPFAVKNYNELNLLDLFEHTGGNGIDMLLNSEINPSENYFYYMHRKWRFEKYGDCKESNLSDSPAERNALRTLFPKTRLLSIMSITCLLTF